MKTKRQKKVVMPLAEVRIQLASPKKCRAKYPALFRFNEHGHLPAINEANKICQALLVEIKECPDVAFETHLKNLANFSNSASFALLALAKNPKLNEIRRTRALESLYGNLHKILADLERFEESEMQRIPGKKSNIQERKKSSGEFSFIEQLAWNRSDWPMLMPRNQKKANARREFIYEVLQLSRFNIFKVTGSRAGLTPVWYTAITVIKTILEWRRSNDSGKHINEAKRLKPPSPLTKDQWFRFGLEKVLPEIYGQEWWKDVHFGEVVGKRGGLSQAKKSFKRCFLGCCNLWREDWWIYKNW